MVLEFLSGQELGDRMKDGRPFVASEVARIASEVLDALADAHHKGVIHRDLKPQNIFLAAVGRRKDVVKLMDFGIAKVFEDQQDGPSMMTGTGAIIGSPRYMAPEQAMGTEVTAQTDLYGLGCTLWEMLCGRPLFDETSPTACILAHINQTPPQPSLNGRLLEGPLVELIMEMIRKVPKTRPVSAESCLQRLRGLSGPPVTDGPSHGPVGRARTALVPIPPAGPREAAQIMETRTLAPTSQRVSGHVSKCI